MRTSLAALAPLLASLLGSCGAASPRAPRDAPLVISIVGTNDLHGHVGALPLLGGYLANLRRARADDGVVLLLDGGDMFQGTLESNLGEGAAVVEAYTALGYDAVTIGNHEFDYGPAGERAAPLEAGDDPRAALRARIAEAPYPFLAANVVRASDGAPLGIGEHSDVILERGDPAISIALIGVTTEATLTTTLAANVSDLRMLALADRVRERATRARDEGASLVVVLAHAGGDCERFDAPDDLTSCDASDEIFELASALAPGLVDVIVAGHTHAGVAHRVNGIAVIESFSYGVAFGRVDVVVDRATRRVSDVRIFAPTRLCAESDAHAEDACAPHGEYEGAPVRLDPRVAAITERAIERARALRDTPLGVTLSAAFTRDRNAECALGNLFADLMLAAHPPADAAVVNGGGLRADLPAGTLAYGSLYEAFPFDNRFAVVRMEASELASMIEARLARGGSFLSLGGLVAIETCSAGTHAVTLARADGEPVPADAVLTVITSDFLATGGDDAFTGLRARDAITLESAGPTIRDAMADALRARGGTLDPASYWSPSAPRIRRCAAPP